ncbi:MAG TPA: hypothetical protein VHB98_17320 [Chloroflexota bacterium]|nr:hypothetical protein [Chloroflexota bacterium]
MKAQIIRQAAGVLVAAGMATGVLGMVQGAAHAAPFHQQHPATHVLGRGTCSGLCGATGGMGIEGKHADGTGRISMQERHRSVATRGSARPLGGGNVPVPSGGMRPLGKGDGTSSPTGGMRPLGRGIGPAPTGGMRPLGRGNGYIPTGGMRPLGRGDGTSPTGGMRPLGRGDGTSPTGGVRPLGSDVVGSTSTGGMRTLGGR